MNNQLEKRMSSNRCIYGKLSIAMPLIGIAVLVSVVFFFILNAKDSEGRLWGQVIGEISGGLILLVSAILGIGFAYVSRKKEKCYLISSVGLIFNIILLLFMLYILFSLSPFSH
jgi:hypothetical protein